MKKITPFLLLFTVLLIWNSLSAQRLSSGFEVRYFTKDAKANGETDFKGETAVLTTDQRINFLNYYASEASKYYGDSELNTEVAPDNEVKDLMASIKPQPLPEVRKRILLQDWKWLAIRQGQHESSQWEINKFTGAQNLLIKDGALYFTGDTEWSWNFAAQTWRFSLGWKVRLTEENCRAEFVLQDNATDKAFVKIDIEGNKFFCFSNNTLKANVPLIQGEWYDIKIEGVLDKFEGSQRYNLYVGGNLLCDFVEANEEVAQFNGFAVSSSAGLEIDDIYGVGYQRTTQVRHPYCPATYIDENFDKKPAITGWQNIEYSDDLWQEGKLPLGQGSERQKGEDLYFRKKINVKSFKRAYLNIETLDPGGEVWVNGKMVTLVKNRYPVRLDITEYLHPYAENQIALKVDNFYLNPGNGVMMPCTYLDNNPGWFAGRAWLDLTGETFVNDVFFYTKSLEGNKANIQTNVILEHKGTLAFDGRMRIKMAVWDDHSGNIEQVAEKSVLIGPGKKKISIGFSLNNPKLWEPGSPNLYKVTVEAENNSGHVIDDYVFTTGIRTLSQQGGTFHLNNKPAMLNGTQIMGFRAPIEKMMSWFRCPPDEWVAKEMLMTKKMNCNMLRIHVHGWKEKAVNVNDPRYAEYADQMGIMLIYGTPAWIREGNWGQVDFEGYHKYMEQLHNHPGIVMWEVSNHPNTFYKYKAYESDLFAEEAYNAVYPYDPSRLISITSHIGHLNYGNDEGTLDKGGEDRTEQIKKVEMAIVGNQDALTSYGTKNKMQGNKIKSTRAWTAPMVTRGNQDAPTGYGADWSRLRKWPGVYRQNFLDSKERAYFDFEHQESIGQPNWNLCKGKPWYLLQSYEWEYDEGSIGRRLTMDEWRESQAWQAFSAYEATKKLRQLDYDGFSWCTLHGGANAATYKKPAIDFLGYGKLVFHTHKTMFQDILAGSNNVDVVYGPDDEIKPMILNLGEARTVNLTIIVRNKFEGKVIDKKIYKNVRLKAGRTVNEAKAFKPHFKDEGMYFIEYLVDANN